MVAANVPLCGSGRCCATAACRAPRSTRASIVEQLRPLAAPWPGGASDERARAARRGVPAGCAARSAYKLERHGRLLPQLVAYLEAAGVEHDHAASWRSRGRGCPRGRIRATGRRGCRSRAGSPPTCRRSTRRPRSRRPGVFAGRYQRPTPYLWSQQDIDRLLDAARALRPPLKAASYEALFGLLAGHRHARRRGDRAGARRRRPRRPA